MPASVQAFLSAKAESKVEMVKMPTGRENPDDNWMVESRVLCPRDDSKTEREDFACRQTINKLWRNAPAQTGIRFVRL